ncbi:MAG: hypothetical protein MJ025_06510 [Victivallaceae bacterium]|nr:hypothetical protein [Victivallaceae bacterium]
MKDDVNENKETGMGGGKTACVIGGPWPFCIPPLFHAEDIVRLLWEMFSASSEDVHADVEKMRADCSSKNPDVDKDGIRDLLIERIVKKYVSRASAFIVSDLISLHIPLSMLLDNKIVNALTVMKPLLDMSMHLLECFGLDVTDETNRGLAFLLAGFSVVAQDKHGILPEDFLSRNGVIMVRGKLKHDYYGTMKMLCTYFANAPHMKSIANFLPIIGIGARIRSRRECLENAARGIVEWLKLDAITELSEDELDMMAKPPWWSNVVI